MEIKIMEGAFDGIPKEDVEAILEAFTAAISNGTLFEESEPVNFEELEKEDPALYEKIMKQIESMDPDVTIHGFVLGDVLDEDGTKQQERSEKD